MTARLLTLEQAALYLGGISPWTVREIAGTPALPIVRLTPHARGRLLFDLRDLDRLIDRAKV